MLQMWAFLLISSSWLSAFERPGMITNPAEASWPSIHRSVCWVCYTISKSFRFLWDGHGGWSCPCFRAMPYSEGLVKESYHYGAGC